jgi:hypothetical protein
MPPAVPSTALLSAALTGLLSFGMGGCGDDKKTAKDDRDDQTEPDAAMPQVDAGATEDASMGNDASPERGDAGADAGPTGPVVTREVPGQRTYASLDADCVALGGYVQVHAACSGSNACAGFSYGDWGEGAVLTEHTCASMNGCNGLSCVVLPKDSGKTGAEVYEADLPPAGPSSCLNCHAVSEHDASGDYLPPDATKFKVWVLPGSTRTVDNWLELSVEAQEAIVAFGKIGAFADGTPIESMKGYHKLYSRAEVERVVAHIRTLTPVIEEIGKPK